MEGLWDIDPQRIVVPILHCPMGLVDKVLESFKNWVNLAVENFGGDTTSENARERFQRATRQHEAAVTAVEQATAFAVLNPTSADAKQQKKLPKGRVSTLLNRLL